MKLSQISINLRYKLINILIKIITPNLYWKLKLSELLIFKISKTIRPITTIMKEYFLNSKVIGVEIGVNSGYNANSLLKELNIEKLYLIDIWKQITDYKQILNQYKNNKEVIIIRDFSNIAVNNFKDNSLDFVYIDANHKYKSVYQDIELWSKKVKIYGIVGGHDIFNILDVLKAVKDYCTINNIIFQIKQPDWYFIKSK